MFDYEASIDKLDQDREKAFDVAMIAYRAAPGGAAQGVRAALAAYQGFLMDAGYETGTLMMPPRGQKK